MLIAWKYTPRGTLIQRLDARARLIFYACFLVSVLAFWDARFLLAFAALALLAVRLARLPWKDTRRAWLLIGSFISLYGLFALFTGGAAVSGLRERVIAEWRAPFSLLGWTPALSLSVERAFYALSQMMRVFSISALTLLIPYTFDPALYGTAFRRLGLPDKLAFALDLTMRFVPSLSRDFTLTMDAQKARGYELDRRQGGLLQTVRRLAPLIVPVVIHSIVSAEEITDAMDLRAFGVRPRTWLRELAYAPRDYALIAFSLALLLASLALSLLGHGRLWVP
jgi:energy-coupling factor transport system permease protein